MSVICHNFSWSVSYWLKQTNLNFVMLFLACREEILGLCSLLKIWKLPCHCSSVAFPFRSRTKIIDWNYDQWGFMVHHETKYLYNDFTYISHIFISKCLFGAATYGHCEYEGGSKLFWLSFQRFFYHYQRNKVYIATYIPLSDITAIKFSTIDRVSHSKMVCAR